MPEATAPRTEADSWPPPRVDCCIALGWELRAGFRVPDGVDWRPSLAHSAVKGVSDDALLAVRRDCDPAALGILCARASAGAGEAQHAPQHRRWYLTRARPGWGACSWGQVRVLLALFMDAVLFGSVELMSVEHEGKWCIYLTHWTLVMVCASLTLAVFGAGGARRSLARDEPPPRRPLWLPVLWSVQAVAVPGACAQAP